MLIAKQNAMIQPAYRRMHLRSSSERAQEAAARVPRYAHTRPMKGPMSMLAPIFARKPLPAAPALFVEMAPAVSAALTVDTDATGSAVMTTELTPPPAALR